MLVAGKCAKSGSLPLLCKVRQPDDSNKTASKASLVMSKSLPKQSVSANGLWRRPQCLSSFTLKQFPPGYCRVSRGSMSTLSAAVSRSLATARSSPGKANYQFNAERKFASGLGCRVTLPSTDDSITLTFFCLAM